MLCEVVGGVVAALTDAAAVWWLGLHELPAVELPAPAEQFLCVEAGQVFAERAVAGQSLATERTVQTGGNTADSGGDQTEAGENSRAVRDVVTQLGPPPLCLTGGGVETNVELTDLADHEMVGGLQVLRLELFSVSSQAVENHSLATVELWDDSSFRNTNCTSHQTDLLLVPPGKSY